VKATIGFAAVASTLYLAFIGAIYAADSRLELVAIGLGFLVGLVSMFVYYSLKGRNEH
jgi:hypothetical protein